MKKSLVFQLPKSPATNGEEDWTLLLSSDPARHHGAPVPVTREALAQQLKTDAELFGHARTFVRAHRDVRIAEERLEPGAVRLGGDGRTIRGALEALRAAAMGAPPSGAAGKAMAALGPKVVAAVPRRPTVARRSRLTFGVPPGERGLFTAPMLKEGYGFPARHGEGQRIAILLLGPFTLEEFGPGLEAYFRAIGLELPHIEVIPMPGVENKPPTMNLIEGHVELVSGLRGTPAARHNGFRWKASKRRPNRGPSLEQILAANEAIRWSGEGIVDVELVGAMANRAKIAVYITNDTAPDIFETIVRAVDEGSTVINCSFGGPEHKHAPGEMPLMDAAMMYAASRGVTVCASTGDLGCAADKDDPDRYAIEYPAASPWVLAVGGTTLLFKTGGGPPSWAREKAWSETILGNRRAGGGGFSQAYEVPPWQVDALAREAPDRRTRRGIPDVSSAAALSSGCWIWFGGREEGVNSAAGGTSAAVPIWSGLVALLNEELGINLGLLAPRLYQPALKPGFFNVRVGNNMMGKLKRYRARQGWNPCAGIGAPRGDALIEAMKAIMERPQDPLLLPYGPGMQLPGWTGEA